MKPRMFGRFKAVLFDWNLTARLRGVRIINKKVMTPFDVCERE